jgi:hypothetical protein
MERNSRCAVAPCKPSTTWAVDRTWRSYVVAVIGLNRVGRPEMLDDVGDLASCSQGPARRPSTESSSNSSSRAPGPLRTLRAGSARYWRHVAQSVEARKGPAYVSYHSTPPPALRSIQAQSAGNAEACPNSFPWEGGARSLLAAAPGPYSRQHFVALTAHSIRGLVRPIAWAGLTRPSSGRAGLRQAGSRTSCPHFGGLCCGSAGSCHIGRGALHRRAVSRGCRSYQLA